MRRTIFLLLALTGCTLPERQYLPDVWAEQREREMRAFQVRCEIERAQAEWRAEWSAMQEQKRKEQSK